MKSVYTDKKFCAYNKMTLMVFAEQHQRVNLYFKSNIVFYTFISIEKSDYLNTKHLRNRHKE